MRPPIGDVLRGDPLTTSDGLAVAFGGILPGREDLVGARELGQEVRRLQIREPVIPADANMTLHRRIFQPPLLQTGGITKIRDLACFIREVSIIGHQHAAFTDGENLRGLE